MLAKRSFIDYRLMFAALYDAVKAGHKISLHQHQGHGLDHDVAVAQMGALIAPDQRTADMAWVAGMIHSTDRLVEKDDLKIGLRFFLTYLPEGYFSGKELGQIFEAALKHSKLNEDDDSLVLQVLKDADRLVNLNLLVVIRGAQHYPHIPAVDLTHLGRFNPQSVYGKPQNCLDNMRFCLEWVDMMRIPTARAFGQRLGAKLKKYIDDAELIFHDLGIAGVEL